MLALTWRYRWGCLWLIAMQLVLLGLGLVGLSLTGTAIDTLQYHATGVGRLNSDVGRIGNPSCHPADLPDGLPIRPTPKPARMLSPTPNWPLGLSPPEEWPTTKLLALLAAGVLAVGVARSAMSFWYAVAVARLTQQRIVVDLRARVYEKLQRLDCRFYASNTSGSLINRVTSDVQNVRTFVDGVLVQMAILLLSLGVYLSYMLRIHVGLTLLCLATTPILWVLGASFSRTVRPAYDRNRVLVDHMLLTLTENVRGAPIVKGFAREPEEMEKFRRSNRAVKDQQQWIFWRVSIFTPTIEFFMSLNLVALLAYGGYLVIHGQLALGSGLIVFSGLLQNFSAQVSKVTNIINSVQQSLVGARRVFEILDWPIEIKSPPHARRLARARGAIEFDGTAFEYRPGHPVLAEISLRIEPGQHVALLGATGEGKTTLLNLVPRFYDATAGRVLVDGIDVRRLHLDDLRRNVGMVFQENFLFSATVAANIAFGRPDATQRQIERAAKIAQADEFIAGLPDGYDTLLRECGKNLSGGQRQRLAIARAILREPPILLLDDATAAVDPETENEILDAMDRAASGRTVLVVAHRLSTLRRADLVVVLKGGRIMEMGTHAELLDRRGPYCRIARLQTEVVNGVPLCGRTIVGQAFQPDRIDKSGWKA